MTDDLTHWCVSYGSSSRSSNRYRQNSPTNRDRHDLWKRPKRRPVTPLTAAY